MKALEIIKNKEKLLIEDSIESKRMKALASSLNEQIEIMCEEINSFENFRQSQIDGDRAKKIIFAKSFALYFRDVKILKNELVVENLRNEEKAQLSRYYNAKNNLIDIIREILKESQKEAIVSAFDIYNGEFSRCEHGHEVIILSGRNTIVLESFLRDIDSELIVNGNFDDLDAQEVDFNTEVLDRNVELCNRKNMELNNSKQGKFDKLQLIINRMYEIGKASVAFFTYKDAMLSVGYSPKALKDYENELTKNYIPLKKTLQKEFKIELEYINDVVINETTYADNIDETMDNESLSQPFSIPSINEEDDDETLEPSYNQYEEDEQVVEDNTTESSQIDYEDNDEISESFDAEENDIYEDREYMSEDNENTDEIDERNSSDIFSSESSSNPFDNSFERNPFKSSASLDNSNNQVSESTEDSVFMLEETETIENTSPALEDEENIGYNEEQTEDDIREESITVEDTAEDFNQTEETSEPTSFASEHTEFSTLRSSFEIADSSYPEEETTTDDYNSEENLQSETEEETTNIETFNNPEYAEQEYNQQNYNQNSYAQPQQDMYQNPYTGYNNPQQNMYQAPNYYNQPNMQQPYQNFDYQQNMGYPQNNYNPYNQPMYQNQEFNQPQQPNNQNQSPYQSNNPFENSSNYSDDNNQ